MTPTRQVSADGTALPALMLAVSACLWGMSWFPFRQLAEGGIDGLWAIMLTELAACGVCVLTFGRRLAGLRWQWPLLSIGLLGGICNTGYVMGTIHGEVLRVTLLLYLAPLWTVFLAHWLLHERITHTGLGIVVLSMAGATVMLWPFGTDAAPLGWPDLWALVAGLAYAGYNVLVRRHQELSVAHKVLSSTLGAGVVAALWIALAGVPWTTADLRSGYIVLLVAGTGTLLVLIVILMQRGLERLPASRAIVILMLELVAAALSAWWLAGEAPGQRELAGGLLIVGASVLSGRQS